MLALFDIGNTHTHIGISTGKRVLSQKEIPTRDWISGEAPRKARIYLQKYKVDGAAFCSVVPDVSPRVAGFVSSNYGITARELNWKNCGDLAIDYPKPDSIGPDRLANSLAAKRSFGAPVVVVDFGTAVTFDVVDSRGMYVGGIIAPGISAMTDYLHEKTALLPRIKIRPIRGAIGKSTESAMLIGAIHGYRGLVRELIGQLQRELKSPRLPVLATGGFARLIAGSLPEITAVVPRLTLEGLRISWVDGQKK